MKSMLNSLLTLAIICCVSAFSQAANPILTKTPEHVIVAPMCAPTEWWGQNKNNTHDGYLGDRVCGCDPTAWGQILTYYGASGRLPDGWTFTPSQNWVQHVVNGEQLNLEKRTTGTLVTESNPEGKRTSATTGNEMVVPTWNSYTWATSNAVDTDENGTPDGKDHAGMLLWDLNVISGAVYSNGTLATLFAKDPAVYDNATLREDTALSSHFTFLQGKGWGYMLPMENSGTTVPQYWKEMVEPLLRGSLQAGAPVQVGVVGHAILCDGFGYHNGVPYFHLNWGWCGASNCWVPTEWFWNEVTTSLAFTHFVVNVQPEDVGCVLAGVVMRDGVPVAGTTVTCSNGETATTDARGGYHFINLAEETTYTVTCGDETQTVTTGTFIDENARSVLQGRESNNKDENGNERIIYIDHGHVVADFGALPSINATLLASVYDFNAAPNGSYTLNLNGNAASADGSVTIDAAPIELTYSGNAWVNTTGVTVLMKYSNLSTNTEDYALVATSRGNSHLGISVESDDGLGKGIDGTSVYYNNNITDARGAVAEEGYVVFVYKYDGSGVSTFGYDGEGEVLYTSSKLKYHLNGDIGKTISLGGVGSSLVAEDMIVHGVRIYEGAVLQEQVTTLVQQFENDQPSAFSWTPGEAPTGWITSWGENSGATRQVVAPSGEVEPLHVVYHDGDNEAQKWHPWSNLTAKGDFTLLTYGCADFVCPSDGKYAVLWCMGADRGNKIALVKDASGNILLVQADSNESVSQSINAGIVKGYHLFTVRFSETGGATLFVDGQEIGTNADLKTKPSDGFRMGSVYGGIGGFERGVGFIPCQMIGYDDADLPTEPAFDQLCATYPAVTAMGKLEYDATSSTLYIPSLSLLNDTIEVTQGNVTVNQLSVENGSTLDLRNATVICAGVSPSITVDVGTLRVSAGQTIPCPIYISASGTLDVVGVDMTEAGALNTIELLDAPVTLADGAQITLEGASIVGNYIPSVQDGKFILLRQPGEDEMATGAVLRIREILPKGSETNLDPNGLESGWVEVENTSPDKWADLADYRFIRINRCKEVKKKGSGNFPSALIPPGGRFVFYTSESYPNGKGWAEDGEFVGLFGTKDVDSKGKAYPKFYPEYNNILVWPDKVNPKKFPFVRLYYAPADGDLEIIDTVVVPSDLPEDASILVGDVTEGQSTLRWICTEPTKGTANPSTEGLTRLGPNVGPLYDFDYNSDYKKKYVASEFEMKNFTPPAEVGKDYTVTLPINPVMAPTGTTANEKDTITSVKLIYRKGFGSGTIVDGEPIEMTQSTVGDYNWGQLYTATIPAAFITETDKGKLIQWKVEMTDASGVTWTSPSFHNKDDGYEWYGTVVEPGDLNSASLPTWHMFADAASVSQMDKDNPDQDVSVTPYNARVAIYDYSTSTYYDYVRIDLRGNTSAHFAKKSHGLRFAKAHPLTMEDGVRGGEVEEFRKSSLISEFGDPSWMRQMVAFWLFDKMGNKTPFDFPVRCNLNGSFYQLAFHSERFSDELIEDYYGLDKFGYGYKNVGTLKSGSGTSAGDIEKKTPDDGDEGDISVLENELRKYLKQYGAENDNATEQPQLTQFVVERFDLPAWLNYIASSKITQEMDDVWANISAYYDNPTMRDGTTRGTGTWMPLAYDFNLSFGQWYYNDVGNVHSGLMADEDWFKSHPFYGGNHVRCYRSDGSASTVGNGNSAYEAIFQSEKFRRLYLRRLRTLMDQELKAPGTPETEVPFMVKMRELAELMRADSKLDQAKWPNDSSDNAIDVWRDAANPRPADIDAGIDEIWNNYVVPRQTHFYVTHSIHNAEKGVGYDKTLSAGIPDAQRPIDELKNGLSAEYNESLKAVVIKNANPETIDLSGWFLTGPVRMTIPPGTVIDCAIDDTPGEVYITTDRRATVARMTLTDQVIVGNASESTGSITLMTADKEAVYLEAPIIPTNPEDPEETAQTVVDAATSTTGIPVLGIEVTETNIDTMVIPGAGEDGGTKITIGDVVVSVPKYYDVGIQEGGSGFSLILNETATPIIGDANVDETEELEPAIAFDTEGNFVITVTESYPKLIYQLQSADSPNGPFQDVEGATASKKSSAFQLKAATGEETAKFYRIVVGEKE